MRILERYTKKFDYDIHQADYDRYGDFEIEIDGDDIKHWLSIAYSPKEIIKFAQMIYPDLKSNELDEAYEILVEDYDEIDELNDYIVDCIYDSSKYTDKAFDELAEYDNWKEEQEFLDTSLPR